jgi:hypothetical protein
MKKFLALLLTFAFTISLIGCGETPPANPKKEEKKEEKK